MVFRQKSFIFRMENQKRSKNKGSSDILRNFLIKKPRFIEIENTVSSSQCVPSTSSENTTVNLLPSPENASVEESEIMNVHISDINDIANFTHRVIGDNYEKLQLLEKFWIPPKNFVFPLETQGEHRRRFNAMWLTKYNWLTYSAIEDAAYCKYCLLFSSSFVGHNSSQSLGALAKKPFRGWKKAKEKFDNHEKAQYHQFSVLRADDLRRSSGGNSVDKVLYKSSELNIQRNRQRLTPIIKTILFCGRMGLPLRGHKDYGPLDLNSPINRSDGNFRNILKLRAESGDKALIDHLNSCGSNATYLSWDIQNQILQICNELIVQKIVDEINDAKAFVILADETTDVSNKEQLTLCARYLNGKYQICEKFLQFVEITSTTGASIAASILETLEKLKINCRYICGQGYDGAAAMSGNSKGVQTLISDKFPAAIYVYCASHNLNLCLSSASEVTEIRNCLGIIERAYVFFNTPKREHALHLQIDSLCPGTNRHSLKKLCPTRWVARHDAVLVFVELYKPLVAALEAIEQWTDLKTSTEASGLLASIKTPKFVIALMCSEKIYSYTLPLSRVLQTVDMNLCKAYKLADDVTDQVKQIRGMADDNFMDIFKKAQDLLSEYNIEIKLPRLPPRQTQRLVIKTDSASEYYRITIFIPFLDGIITNLQNRFSKHKQIITNFECLFPDNDQDFDSQLKSFLELHSLYKDVFIEEFCSHISLKAELQMWYKINANKNLRDDLLQRYSECDANIFPNIKRILQIFLTLPVSTASAERSFSNLKYLKNYLRNTMEEERLNSLAVLYTNQDINITVEEILDQMAKKKRRISF